MSRSICRAMSRSIICRGVLEHDVTSAILVDQTLYRHFITSIQCDASLSTRILSHHQDSITNDQINRLHEAPNE